MYKLTSTIILLALSSVSLNAFSAADKVEVCHKGQEINVASSSLSAHEAHGDWEGDCDEGPTEPGPDPDSMTVVVMMRCEAIAGNGVVVVSASSSADLNDDVAVILPIPPPVDPRRNCAAALAALLNAGFQLRSITGGSADSGGSLHLYTDYLLIGKMSEGS